MSVPLTINGVTFSYPSQFDLNWGPTLTNWSTAVTNGMLQKAGGTFTLTSEVDFGASYGLKTLYYKSRETNPGSTGILRLGNASTGIVWRNALNNGDLGLTVNSSNQLTFNGAPIAASSSLTDSHIYVGNASNQPNDVAMTGDIAIDNAGVTSIGTGVIVDADVNASAAIALSKLASSTAYYWYVANAAGVLTPISITASKAIASDANGLPVASSVTATELGYLSGVGSAIQTQINGLLPLTGGTMTGVINMGNHKINSLAVATTTGDALPFPVVSSYLSANLGVTGSFTIGSQSSAGAAPLLISESLSGPTNTLLVGFFGSGGGIGYGIAQTTQAGTFASATAIASMSTSRGETHDFHVSGRATGKVFADKVLVVIDDSGTASSPSTYATSATGSPVARTYTVVSGALKLLMSGNATSYTLGVLDHYST